MKQKILKLLAAPALLLAAGITLSGCVNDFDGTNVNYEEKKQEITDNLGTADKAWTGYVDVWTDNIQQAEKQSHINLNIYSPTKLDMTTVDSAITFYKLKANTDNASYYPMHDGELAKEQVGTTVSESWRDYAQNGGNNEKGLQTVIKYDVNTESVTTNKIAVIVDATKLKDVFGNFVLNLDGNYKAGQESDNWITYIGVNKQSDGTTNTTPINNIYREEFRKEYNPINPFPDTNTPANGLQIAPNGSEGKWDITIPAFAVAKEPGETPACDETLADIMKQSFVLRTKGLDESAYKDVALEWAYEAGTPSVYKATTAELPYGTKFNLLMIKPEYSAPAWYAKVYGHAGFTDTDTTGSKRYLLNTAKDSYYIKDQPDYIINSWSDPDDSTWSAGEYTLNTITNNQKALFNGLSPSTTSKYISNIGNTYYYKWTITPATDVELKTYDDFIVTDNKYNKIEAVISYVKESDDTIRTIYIELKNNVSFTPKLFVGSGTTLEENTAYPKQLKFGTPYKDPSKGDAAGYIQLY